MGRGKNAGVFLLLTAALTLLSLLAFPGFWRDCAASLTTGRQALEYTRACESGGVVYAVGRDGDEWVLTRGALDGDREKQWTLASLGMERVKMVEGLYACSDGGVVLALYEQREDLACRVYYLAPGAKEARMIYGTLCEEGVDMGTFGLTENGGTAVFLLRQGGAVSAFRYELGGESAFVLHEIEPQGTLYVLPDGKVASAAEGVFVLGEDPLTMPSRLRPVEGWRLTEGACLLSGDDGSLWRADLGTGRWTKLAVLDEVSETEMVVSVSVSPDGGALFLTDGGELQYLWDGGFRDCSRALYRPRWQSGLMLAGAVAGILLVSLGLWYFLCEYRRLQITLVVRQGVAVALLLAAAASASVRLAAGPYFADWAAWDAEGDLKREALSETPEDWTLEAVSRDGAVYLVEDGQETVLAGSGLGTDWREAAERALTEGGAFLEHSAAGVDCCSYFLPTTSTRLRVMLAESAPYHARADRGLAWTARLIWGTAGLTLAVVLLALLSLRRRLQRVTAGMDALHAGQGHVRVVDWGGDEIGAMADSLNSLAVTLRMAGEEETRRGDLYARFLPARIAQLLGEKSVDQIGKHSFASSRMACMHVSFAFDERVYEDRSKALFENINEITECTAKIISDQGGTILSFSHEGFDAFFPAADAAPISAAVAICQETAGINRSRERRGISPVRLHIALDEGEVMLGVVGDEKRMQVTAVSSSFSTIRMLTGLFGRFEAGILCTEAIESRAGAYGRRYIGKAHDGAGLVRVYELYDGDAQTVRQGKAETARAFSDGVYTLYAGDYTAAKQTFMEISRRCGGDGPAKFYLYLADRFEKEAPEEVSLDG